MEDHVCSIEDHFRSMEDHVRTPATVFGSEEHACSPPVTNERGAVIASLPQTDVAVEAEPTDYSKNALGGGGALGGEGEDGVDVPSVATTGTQSATGNESAAGAEAMPISAPEPTQTRINVNGV